MVIEQLSCNTVGRQRLTTFMFFVFAGVFGICRYWGCHKSPHWIEWEKIRWKWSNSRLLFREQICSGRLWRLIAVLSLGWYIFSFHVCCEIFNIRSFLLFVVTLSWECRNWWLLSLLNLSFFMCTFDINNTGW